MTDRQTTPARPRSGFDCGQCGMYVESGAEYHPYRFCVLHKAGQEPRAILKAERKRWESEVQS